MNTKSFGYAGEDSYFCCSGKNGVFGMGVADGVYAWKHMGIDSGAMSRHMMQTASNFVQSGCEDVVKGARGGGAVKGSLTWERKRYRHAFCHLYSKSFAHPFISCIDSKFSTFNPTDVW